MKILDKSFEVEINETEIISRIKEIATEINKEYKGKKPLFLCILNGSFMFTADLVKEIDIKCQISFIKFQ